MPGEFIRRFLIHVLPDGFSLRECPHCRTRIMVVIDCVAQTRSLPDGSGYIMTRDRVPIPWSQTTRRIGVGALGPRQPPGASKVSSRLCRSSRAPTGGPQSLILVVRDVENGALRRVPPTAGRRVAPSQPRSTPSDYSPVPLGSLPIDKPAI